jgi:osmoprotectant transport system permease protein
MSNYLFDGSHWSFATPCNIPMLILQHLGFSFLAVAVAAVIALPLGLYIGHTGRFSFVAVNAANAGRSLPTLGLIILLVTLFGLGFVPVLVALVILAIPPILTSTFSGVQAVDPAVVDAAKGMGFRGNQILFRVEIPNALPLISSGLRNALLQVVATATVAAYVGFGGLGRLLVDGLALNDYGRMVAGAVVVAALAIVLDLLAAFVQDHVVSPGVSGRALSRTAKKSVPPTAAPPTATAPVGSAG